MADNKEVGLSHISKDNQPTMVDVSHKANTRREAKAEGRVYLPPPISSLFQDGDIVGPKGPVFQTAIVAATQGSKKTWDLIPFCHPIPLENISIEIKMEKEGLAHVLATAVTTGKTGVEMEALTAVSLACLTIYDMCKAMSHEMEIRDIRLLSKSGGKSDYRQH